MAGDGDRFVIVCQQRLPSLVTPSEAKAKGIMLRADDLKRFLQDMIVEIGWSLEQERLVPVVLRAKVLFEEPVLNWREIDPAGRASDGQDCRLLAPVHAARQRRDCRVLEQIASGDVENSGASAAGDDLDAKN